MALSIKGSWCIPVDLLDGAKSNFIYQVADLESIPDKPGVYIFARTYGEHVAPVYIGQAENLRSRIKQQLNNVNLMMGIKNLAKGKRILIYCEAEVGRGQDKRKVLSILENSLIDHALAEGHELLNKQGTKRPTHSIEFTGNRVSEKVAPRRMFVRSVLTRNSSGRKKKLR